jgi:hypothetical protein
MSKFHSRFNANSLQVNLIHNERNKKLEEEEEEKKHDMTPFTRKN